MRTLLKFILLFAFGYAGAQKVTNVKLGIEGDKVVVHYDIDKYSTKRLYNVKISFQSTTKITPFALSGDVGSDIVAGKDLKIVWDLYQDIDGLSGNLKAEIEVEKGKRIKYLGRPRAAFLSALLPGLGDYFVVKNRWQPWLTHISFLGTAWGAFANSEMIGREYNSIESYDQSALDAAYKQDLQYYQNTKYLMFAAAGIYVGDILFVSIKGAMNKRKHPYYKKRFEKHPQKQSVFYMAPNQFKGGQLVWNYNF